MHVRTKLNGLQRMMLRWEEFHPLNAVHVVQLGDWHEPQAVEDAALGVCRTIGILPVTFSRRRTSIEFIDERSDGFETSPLFAHVRVAEPTLTALEAIVDEQLNHPFAASVDWPIRFLLVETQAEEQYLVLCYRHVLSDSHGISLLIREILRAMQGKPPLVPGLDVAPSTLAQLFPKELGWRGLARRMASASEELWAARRSFIPPRRDGSTDEFTIQSTISSTQLPTDRVKETARSMRATVHTLVLAALLEGFQCLFAEKLRGSRRDTLSIYSPADLRREAGGRVDTALGQILGSFTTRLSIVEGTPFSRIVAAVAAQQTQSRECRRHREHSAHMNVMSRIWDCVPRIANRTVGPYLLPQTGFVSNVNLAGFLAEEVASGSVRNYFRFTGTGILSPMMLGVTTLESNLNITTTHHTNIFTRSDVDGLIAHIRWRLESGGEDVSREELDSQIVLSIANGRRPVALAALHGQEAASSSAP